MNKAQRYRSGLMVNGRIAAVCDVRGTPEFIERITRMQPVLPPAFRSMPIDMFP